MTDPGGAPRARALAGALRQARADAGISVREVARRLNTSHSVVSYWETGKRVPRLEDVAGYLTAINVTGGERETILDLARHAGDQDWLAVGIPGMSQQLAGTMECERAAATITDWSPHIVPGLLQTSDYARTIIGGGSLPTKEVEARVLVRMGRRDVVTRSDPVRLTTFLGEAALHEMIGGPKVMAGQLRHLAKTVAESETTTIRIVRSNQGWHPGLSGPFVLYDFDGAPSIVLLEHHRTGAFIIDSDDVAGYRSAVDKLRERAMAPDKSHKLITETARRLEEVAT